MVYIPENHKKYSLLPRCRNNGGEVFSYPGKLLSQLNELVGKPNHADPYGFISYEHYEAFLDSLTMEFSQNQEITSLIAKYKVALKAMNRKEEWSILKYIGGYQYGILGLTNGRDYYWPCFAQSPEYEGVIDDEEYTSYLYPTDSDCWLILEDPTGMARKTIFGREKNSLSQKEYERVMETLQRDLDNLGDSENGCESEDTVGG